MPPIEYEDVKTLIAPRLKLEVGKPRRIRILSEMRKGKDLSAMMKDGDKKMAPPDIVDVLDLDREDGEIFEMVVNAVLKSTFEKDYAGGKYKGKAFRVVKLDKREGKNYSDFGITEIAEKKVKG